MGQKISDICVKAWGDAVVASLCHPLGAVGLFQTSKECVPACVQTTCLVLSNGDQMTKIDRSHTYIYRGQKTENRTPNTARTTRSCCQNTIYPDENKTIPDKCTTSFERVVTIDQNNVVGETVVEWQT